MADSRSGAHSAAILTPHDAQRLRQACPDLDDWPRTWHVMPADIAIGQQIVAVLTPFLLHLLDRSAANSSGAVTTTMNSPDRTSKTPCDNSSKATVGH
jgi:hypothetical protein